MRQRSFLLLFLTFTLTSCKPLRCEFYKSKSDYTCRVQNNTHVFDGSRVTVDAIEGDHLPKHSNYDVNILLFRSIRNLGALPIAVELFFPNISSLVVISSSLRHISQGDLKPFRRLTTLYAAQNQLTRVAGELFAAHPRMSSIVLKNNPIDDIDVDAFDGLKILEYLDLSGLRCYEELGHADGKNVRKLIEKIQLGACKWDLLESFSLIFA